MTPLMRTGVHPEILPACVALRPIAAGGLSGVEAGEHVGAARALCYYLDTGLGVDQAGRSVPNPEPIEKDYFEAVLPRVIQAHPRGLSGGLLRALAPPARGRRCLTARAILIGRPA
jgi:hypothetical protein